MKYSNLTIENPNFLKRFSHQSRFIEAGKLLEKYKSLEKFSLLDFGSGDGYFIKFLKEKKFFFDFNAYDADPEEKQIIEMKNLFKNNNIKDVGIYNEFKKIDKKFNFITCLETLEHFNEEDQTKILNQIKSLLKEDGRIIISVPIEVYLSGFAKMIFRFLVNQNHENTSIKNLFKTLFGIPIIENLNDKFLSTHEMNYKSTHVGFYYFNLISLIKKMRFKIEEIKFSPFPFLSSIFNSQILLKIKI